ncbi:hypothetical protein DPEC_G00204040 [Dallia pectoralis]|uniref:Uncharacterized protein n=1 Tax=Dallia pectoralis TaxID=75939 RepID=A0ACC2G9S3_DALPE|nr:hypothetical protein DPEC_G00204040 [Dallia pectoralis]
MMKADDISCCSGVSNMVTYPYDHNTLQDTSATVRTPCVSWLVFLLVDYGSIVPQSSTRLTCALREAPPHLSCWPIGVQGVTEWLCAGPMSARCARGASQSSASSTLHTCVAGWRCTCCSSLILKGMNSLAMSTKWPSYDSLPDTPSFLLSESDVTEDEAEIDVFTSESEGDGAGSSGGGKVFSGANKAVVRRSMVGGGEVKRFSHAATYPSRMASPGCAALSREEASRGDQTFALKCSELQRFIGPLLDLLNGLKKGRFERGLSSFQSSVAIDRLQRILGILQKPDMGEKFLHTLLQVEMMLKIWFPNVTPVTATQNPTPSLPPRWHKNQLCMPVKKRKLSWLDSDFTGGDLPSCKRPQMHKNFHEVTSQDSIPSSTHVGPREPEVSFATEMYSPSSLTVSRRRRGSKRLDESPRSVFSRAATQDGYISSTVTGSSSQAGTVKTETDITTVDSQRWSHFNPTLLRSVKQEWSTGT